MNLYKKNKLVERNGERKLICLPHKREREKERKEWNWICLPYTRDKNREVVFSFVQRMKTKDDLQKKKKRNVMREK